MNKVILHGHLARNPEIRYSQNQQQTAVTRFTLAVNRRFQSENGQKADFINCVALGKTAEIIDKYFLQGSPIVVSGRIQTGSYTNKDGVKVYTFDVLVEDFDFAGNKNNSASSGAQQRPQNQQTNNTGSNQQAGYTPAQYAGGFTPAGMGPSTPNFPNAQSPQAAVPNDYSANGFMNIPDGLDEELPFN